MNDTYIIVWKVILLNKWNEKSVYVCRTSQRVGDKNPYFLAPNIFSMTVFTTTDLHEHMCAHVMYSAY